MNYTFEKLRDIIECFDPCMDNYLYVYCTKSLARWLALRTIRSPLFLKNKSSSFLIDVVLLRYPYLNNKQYKKTAMLMLSWIFKLNNYISENFYRPPPF